ncbi:sensor histidine kinase [Paucidesulfovibrio longus]|uniref:sensor histidine kinase n=1 Tax=Paucidesulfovibrio longus TaxID=889 RepID=UPI00040F84D2|nr:PAS domain-containing protein [Paucidesulfovibrio longus]
MNRQYPKRSLSTNLTISLVAAVVILVATLLGVQHWNMASRAASELEVKADNYADELAEILAIPMWTLDTSNVRHVGQVYERNDLFSRLRITDSRGEVLYQYEADDRSAEEISRTRSITFEGHVIGHLDMALSMATQRKTSRQLFYATMINIAATTAALLAATGILLRIFLRRPLSELESAMDRVAQGDFSRPFTGPRYTELERIIDSFHKMSATIRAREESLRRVNEALSISEQRLNMAITAANDGLWDWNIPRNEAYYSPRWFTMLGYEPDSLPPHVETWENLLHPDDKERVLAELQAHLRKSEDEFTSEFRMRTQDDGYRWILTRGQVSERGAQGEPLRMAGTHQDITDRKEAEALREELINELEEKNAELERFTYTVSHDLKSPLITIKGFLGMLQRDLERGDKEHIAKDMDRIGQAADKMQQLLDELLELSRVGRLNNPPENVNLEKLAHEAVELVAGQISERGVKVDIQTGLPTVRGDRPRLLEVFQNLVDNATKFMGDQPQPHIEIGLRHDKGQEVIYVKDNGLGIKEQYFQKVFGLFDQLDQGKGGTGIGLALVKRVIETHGGTIWVESEGPGRGATFCFTLKGVD